MKRRPLFRTSAVLATSLAAFGPHAAVKAASGEKEKKQRSPATSHAPSQKMPSASGPPLSTPSPASRLRTPIESSTLPLSAPSTFNRPAPLTTRLTPPAPGTAPTKFPWRANIVTTTFWVGEHAAQNNPVHNYASSWDVNWTQSFGGFDNPDRKQRAQFMPVEFVPQQNPFYIALPYNDITSKGHKPEAATVIPWFKEAYRGPGKTVLKGRWVAIRFKDRTAYAQWEDCGPFRTDHFAYVFGDERPKPNLNRGAGLDVSPAVRDYLGMADTDVTDWRFADFAEVPHGPWATHGENNTFVQLRRANEPPIVLLEKELPAARNSPANSAGDSLVPGR